MTESNLQSNSDTPELTLDDAKKQISELKDDMPKVATLFEFLVGEIEKLKTDRTIDGIKENISVAEDQKSSNQKELVEVISLPKEGLSQEEKDLITSDYTNGDIEYVERQIGYKANDIEKRAIAMNVYLKKANIPNIVISASPMKGYFTFVGKSGFGIYFSIDDNSYGTERIYLPKLGTSDQCVFYQYNRWKIKGVFELLAQIDSVIDKARFLEPEDKSAPFKSHNSSILFTTSEIKGGLFGGGKNKVIRFGGGKYAEKTVEYLNSRWRVFSSDVKEIEASQEPLSHELV